MKTTAYLRVSTLEQDTEKNKLEILQFANQRRLGDVEFIEEYLTSQKHYKDRELGSLLNSLKAGDVLIVPELSRLARSVAQILEVINTTKQQGITLYSLKENFCNNDNSITATVTSTIFALVAQIERELISLRTREALQAKKAGGYKLGRPKGRGKSKLDEHTEDIKKLLALKVPKTIIAKNFRTSLPNLYNFLKNLEVSAC